MPGTSSSPHSFLRKIFFLFMLALILLFYLALLSYHPHDPSINSAHFPPAPIKNLVGIWGAALSSNLVYYLGFGACLVPLPFLLMSFVYFKGQASSRISLIYLLCSVLVYGCLVYFLSKFLPSFHFYSYEYSSVGTLGTWFAENVYAKLGRLGSPILACLFSLAAGLLIWRQK